jgi:RHS repeat-associated protein
VIDCNDDGIVDSQDASIIKSQFGIGPPDSRADVNGDGIVDSQDYSILKAHFGSSIASDELVTHPTLESSRGKAVSGLAPTIHGICDIGHQGLMHDREFGLIYNRARYLHPVLGRFMQRDPIGYRDGMSLYEYVASSPTAFGDPTGERIFFRRQLDKGGESGTITMYNLLRYKAASGEEKTMNIEAVAAEHKRLLEQGFNDKNYVYNDGKAKWRLKLVTIITTKPCPISRDEFNERFNKLKDPDSEEWAKLGAEYWVNTFGFTEIKVTGKRSSWYSLRCVPGADPQFSHMTFQDILLHELVGHLLNNMDERNTTTGVRLPFRDWYVQFRGEAPEVDSLMRGDVIESRGRHRFYNRHFAAGIDDISNITGGPINKAYVTFPGRARPSKLHIGDMTHELVKTDPAFGPPNVGEKESQYMLREIERIIKNANNSAP